MAFTRKQVVTTLSVLYLFVLTALAASALYMAKYFSLPIPNIISALTVALPPLAGITVQSLIAFDEKLSTKSLPLERTWHATTVFFVIYESVLATLAGVRILPASTLVCGLRDRWTDLFLAEDEPMMKRIEEAFQCCGFRSARDMPWPFPDGTHGNNTCVVQYGWDRSCLHRWRIEEQKVAAMLLVVPVGVFIWQLMLFIMPHTSTSWLQPTLPFPNDTSAEQRRRSRPSIGYRDDPASRDDDESLAGEVARLNSESSVASQVEASRTKPSTTWHHKSYWRNEQERV